MLQYFGTAEAAYAAIAQLDRVTDYESVGRGFESLSPYQKSRYPFGYLLFCYVAGLERSNPTARWAVGRWDPYPLSTFLHAKNY